MGDHPPLLLGGLKIWMGGMKLVTKWLSVVLLTYHHEMCKAGAVYITKEQDMIVQMRLYTPELLETPEILQISGMNYNYEDKCFRDFQSNSYLKRVQKLKNSGRLIDILEIPLTETLKPASKLSVSGGQGRGGGFHWAQQKGAERSPPLNQQMSEIPMGRIVI